MKVKGKYILVGVAIIAIVLVLIVAIFDVGTGIVEEMAPKAAKDALGVDLTLEAVSGNPIKGYTLKNLALSKEDEEIFSIKQLEAKPSLLALIGGKLYLKSVVLDGALFDFDKIVELAKSFEPKGTEEELPLGAINIKSSEIKGPFGTIDLRNIEIKPEMNAIKATLDASYNDVLAKGNATILIKDGIKIENLSLQIADGEIFFSGTVMPELDLEGKVKNLDLERLKNLWPPLKEQLLAGKLGGKIKLIGKVPEVQGMGDITFSQGMLVGLPVERAGASWKYAKNELHFQDIDANILNGVIKGNIVMSLRNLPPHLDLNLEGKDIDLNLIAKSFPQMGGKISGIVSKVNVKLSGMAMELSGNALLSSKKLSVMGQTLEEVEANVRIEKGKTVKFDTSSRWNKTPLKARGDIDLSKGQFVNVSLSWQNASLETAKTILPSLKEFPIKGNASGEVTISGSLKDVHSFLISGKTWSEGLVFAKEQLISPFVNFEFKDNVLSLKAFSASWRGASIKGAGKISDITKAAMLNLEGRVDGLNLSNLKQLVPQLSSYDLAGVVSSQWTLKGPLSSPELALDFYSNKLAFYGMSANNLSGSTSLKPLDKNPLATLSAFIKASAIGTPSFAPLQDLTASIKAEAEKITVGDVKGRLLQGNLQASGQITMPKDQNPAVVFDVTVEGAKLSSVNDFGLNLPLEGKANIKAQLKGTLPNVTITADATSPQIAFAGFSLTDVSTGVEGLWNSLQIKSFNAKAGGGSLTASGNINYDKSLKLKLDVSGNSLDLKEMAKTMKGADKLKLNGAMDVKANIIYDERGFEGTGEATSPEAGAYGLKASSIKIPFNIKNNKIASQSISAELYEGKASGKGSFALTNFNWDTSLNVTGVNIDSLLHDLFPLEGHISGKGSFQFAGNGVLGKNIDGNGSFSIGEGKISDFKIVKMVSAAYGKSSINYRSIEGRYILDSMALTLLPGTQVYAPKGDPMYTYFGADGTIRYDGKLNLSCYGHLNVQAINAIVGGVKGGILAGEGLETAVKGFLSGLLEGGKQSDFREVSFNLTGTFESPKISDFHVSQPEGMGEETLEKVTPDQEQMPTDKQESPEDVIKKTILEKIFKN